MTWSAQILSLLLYLSTHFSLSVLLNHKTPSIRTIPITLPFATYIACLPFVNLFDLLGFRGSLTTQKAGRVMDQTELKRVFQLFDRNGDGRITKKELNESLEKLGIFIPDKDLSQMIDKIDINGDGCVDIEEFGELYQTIMEEREEEEEEDMKEAFNVFDRNGDGFITVDELRSVLGSLGLKQGRTVEDCKKMITKVDVDGDGMVNYNEFKQMMKAGGFN